MRIGTGGISHETNTFSVVPTTKQKFEAYIYREEQEILQCNTGVRSYTGGLIDEAAVLDVELVASVEANSMPSSWITKDALETMRDRMLELLKKQHAKQPLDGIALALHGAGSAIGYPDVEGEILRSVREEFGPDMPIGVVLDLHGNITETMMEYADILIGIKCYPHVDMYESGRELLKLLHRMIVTGEKPAMKLIKLPWVLAPSKAMTTTDGPAHDIQQLCLKLEKEDPELMWASFFHGFPYADVTHTSVSVTTLAKTKEAAERCASAIAEYAWSRRAELIAKAVYPAEAIDKALKLGVRPVVINESSDNPGGGAPGDSTHLLRELLNRNLPDTAFGYIYDPEVVQQAVKAGVGATISCKLGAKTDDKHGTPIEIEAAYVKAIADGKHIKITPVQAGVEMNMGLSVLLIVGNVQIVVGSMPDQTMDKGPFQQMGIDYEKMHILGLKSSQHFRGWWQDRAAICSCDPPGIHCGDLSLFTFENVNQTYYPFDMNREWKPV